VLERAPDGAWTANHADTGEVEQQVTELEKYISEFREKQKRDAADASALSLDEELGVRAPNASP
jgi:hypothetical protein